MTEYVSSAASKKEERKRKQEEIVKELQTQDLDGYQKLSKIGEGTYGIVFKARQTKTNRLVALKKIRLNFSEGVPTTAVREIALLKEVNHTNVIRLLDLIQKDTSIYLVFDFSEVDLRRYMDAVGRKGLTPAHIKSFMHQLICGIRYCHSHRILHRDLKPQNLLIDRNGKLTIADLGLSRAFAVPLRTYTHNVITLWYRAPEILLGSRHYSTAVDMWSIGCIFAELMILRPLFPGDSQIDELFHIFRLLGTPSEEEWPGVTALPDYNPGFPVWNAVDLRTKFKTSKHFVDLGDHAFDLLKSMITYNPAERIAAKTAEEHDYFYDDLSMLQF
ncbi:kinase-like domain-containing protein [Radiomyces spectabilis]|uniref:kinase-like domain-containing protein n=1 Tax=Radiomyces spectabilis TaxID=64574 RepID=UPI00221FEB0B|nr:kinase-like domain-containing protein [Radiomyces spectabilis]KAI8381378.1 kinase-like domain-containing protein [Radiomyces spectabilis]